ncbi:unnamed protein product [Acanthosepion pharaonis]|uniref:Uncharacterized protein n=1 Tax=Acanthosepion pharaonis TaxID=158019 RepID=A0A812C5F9_ACAPH|nr:unnamed protein product [Sepia pharaonis]
MSTHLFFVFVFFSPPPTTTLAMMIYFLLSYFLLVIKFHVSAFFLLSVLFPTLLISLSTPPFSIYSYLQFLHPLSTPRPPLNPRLPSAVVSNTLSPFSLCVFIALPSTHPIPPTPSHIHPTPPTPHITFYLKFPHFPHSSLLSSVFISNLTFLLLLLLYISCYFKQLIFYIMSPSITRPTPHSTISPSTHNRFYLSSSPLPLPAFLSPVLSHTPHSCSFTMWLFLLLFRTSHFTFLSCSSFRSHVHFCSDQENNISGKVRNMFFAIIFLKAVNRVR